MTCIIGLEFEGKVYLAGDKLGSNGWRKSEYSEPRKIFENGDAIFGYTSTFRWGQLLEFGLKDIIAPDDTSKMQRWLVTVVVPKIRNMLEDVKYDVKASGANALIGIKGQLWEYQDDHSVIRSVNGYAAVGSGESFANAAMAYALQYDKPTNETEVKSLLQNVMKVVSHHCASVGGACYIISK